MVISGFLQTIKVYSVMIRVRTFFYRMQKALMINNQMLHILAFLSHNYGLVFMKIIYFIPIIILILRRL